MDESQISATYKLELFVTRIHIITSFR